MTELVEKLKPDEAAIEKLFFFKNQTTVMPVAHARGVILTVLEKYNVPIFEYTPMEVKQVLTGKTGYDLMIETICSDRYAVIK